MGEKKNESTKYGTLSREDRESDTLKVRFYRSDSGREPVREWLERLEPRDRDRVEEGLQTLQFGWPLGMPLARKLRPDLWELRSRLYHGIARIIFTVSGGELVLLSGFVKKSQKLPRKELELAKRRLNLFKSRRKL